MKTKKIVVYNDKVEPALVKTVVVKYSMPSNKEFIKLFNSVDWERSVKRVSKNKKTLHPAKGRSDYSVVPPNFRRQGRRFGDR